MGQEYEKNKPFTLVTGLCTEVCGRW